MFKSCGKERVEDIYALNLLKKIGTAKIYILKKINVFNKL